MPREDTRTQPQAPVGAPETTGGHQVTDVTDTPRRRLQDLLELIAQTPGWEVERYPDGKRRIVGPNRVFLNVLPNAGYEELARLQADLTRAGWSWVEAETHVARLQARYEAKAALVPDGGYPKEDWVITRAKARELIEIAKTCGCNWRPLKPQVVKDYAEVMNDGEWPWFSPEVMVLSAEHGCPLDGRQRLEAFLRSSLQELGVSVILGYPRAMFKYLNHGSKRSTADILAGDGLNSDVRKKVGPAVQLAMRFDSGTPWKTWKDMTSKPLKISAAIQPETIGPDGTIQPAGKYAEMPGKPYSDALTLVSNPRVNTGCKMLPAVGAAASFIIRRDWPKGPQDGYPDDPWEEFRTALVYGDNLPRGDARFALRNQLLNRDTHNPNRNASAIQLAQVLLAWAWWLNEVPTEQIAFRTTQKMPGVWIPGARLPGAKPVSSVRNRIDRHAARTALELETDEDEKFLKQLDFEGE